MKNLVKTKWIIVIGIVSVTFYFLGQWISSIYGFDPPYFYFYTGLIMILISLLSAILFVILGILMIIKQLRS